MLLNTEDVVLLPSGEKAWVMKPVLSEGERVHCWVPDVMLSDGRVEGDNKRVHTVDEVMVVFGEDRERFWEVVAKAEVPI